jgi:hypothetical protein
VDNPDGSNAAYTQITHARIFVFADDSDVGQDIEEIAELGQKVLLYNAMGNQQKERTIGDPNQVVWLRK